VEADDFDWIADWFGRAQALAEPFLVLRDDGIGGGEDVPR